MSPDPPPELPDIVPLLGAVRDLLAWLDQERVPGLIVGGVAVSLLGRTRLTQDVDAVVWLEWERWESFLDAGSAFGFEPRIPDALAFARQARVLLARHAPSALDIDISLGALPFEEEMIRRGRRLDVEGLAIPLPTPEDLIIMKVVANRPRDWSDIEGLVAANPELDEARIIDWIRQFAEILETPELVTRLDETLHPRR